MGKFSKQPACARVHEEEKYKFIKEQIRPQKRKYVISFTRRILETVISAIIFGGIAGFVFWNVNNRLGGIVSVQEKGISTMEYQTPDNTAIPDNSNQASKEDTGSDDLTLLEEYNRASKRLSAVGDKFADSIVSILDNKDKPVWYKDSQGNTKDVISGMLLKETAEWYYILTSGDLKETVAVDVEF